MEKPEGTDRRHQELLHFLHGSSHLDLGPRLRVLHRDENVQVLVQVLPVGLPSVLLLLKRGGGDRDVTKACSVTARFRVSAGNQRAPESGVNRECESSEMKRASLSFPFDRTTVLFQETP